MLPTVSAWLHWLPLEYICGNKCDNCTVQDFLQEQDVTWITQRV